MENVKKTELFESTPIPKAVAVLAIPTIVSSLVMVLYNLADTYFVSMLNDPIQNSAVTLAAPVLLAFNAINNLFGVGSSSMMSRAMGKRDFDTFSRSSAFGFYGSLSFGVLLAVLCTVFKTPLLHLLGADVTTAEATSEYMLWTVTFGTVPSILNVVLAYMVRSEGNTLHASIGTMFGCVLNIILDPIFILPASLNMGAAGAGLATFISNCAACSYFFILLMVTRKKTYIRLGIGYFGFKRSILLGVIAVGLPAAIQNLLNVTGMTVLNNFTSVFGADAITAMGITQKISLVPMYISMGLGQGIMPLVGYTYASGDIKRMKSAISFSVKIAIGFLTAIAAVFFVTSGGLIALFMKNSSVVAYGSRFLRGFSLSLPFLGLDFLAVGVFQACGMGKQSLVFAILRKVALEIPALYLLNFLFPLYGLAYAQLCAEVVLAAAAAVILVRMIRRLEINQKDTHQQN